MHPALKPKMEEIKTALRAQMKQDVWNAIKEKKADRNNTLPVDKLSLVFKNVWNGFVGFMQMFWPSWADLKWVGDELMQTFEAIYRSKEVAKQKAADFLKYLKTPSGKH